MDYCNNPLRKAMARHSMDCDCALQMCTLSSTSFSIRFEWLPQWCTQLIYKRQKRYIWTETFDFKIMHSRTFSFNLCPTFKLELNRLQLEILLNNSLLLSILQIDWPTIHGIFLHFYHMFIHRNWHYATARRISATMSWDNRRADHRCCWCPREQNISIMFAAAAAAAGASCNLWLCVNWTPIIYGPEFEAHAILNRLMG